MRMLPTLGREQWLKLLALAHTDKRRAFQVYAEHHLRTHGRVYWSDTMQLSTYIPTYAEFLAEALGRGAAEESLVISELYVPPESLMAFMRRSRGVLRGVGVEDIYGTIRAIRRDETTFLAWAKQQYACIIFNLRTLHTSDGIERRREASRRLIDAAAEVDGSFYLTYHRWATREQVLRCYPQFPEFLRRKREHDPGEVFQSDWYVHYRDLIGASGRTIARARRRSSWRRSFCRLRRRAKLPPSPTQECHSDKSPLPPDRRLIVSRRG